MNKAKIMRSAERALKRTGEYLENRTGSSDPEDNYQLDYVLIGEGKPVPDNAFAYAHYEDCIISFYPLEGRDELTGHWDQAFSFDLDLFSFLEQGYELAGMSLAAHCAAWGEIAEYHHCDYFDHRKGLQMYLRYCKRNGITASLLCEKCQYDGMDVMTLYNKNGK